jgi:hypothetical protein
LESEDEIAVPAFRKRSNQFVQDTSYDVDEPQRAIGAPDTCQSRQGGSRVEKAQLIDFYV